MDLDPKAVITIVAMLTGASVCWSAAFAWARWLARPTPRAPSVDRYSADEDRLNAIDNAIHAVAIEVERISEGQRFTTRLLEERASQVPGVSKPAEYRRTNTPH